MPSNSPSAQALTERLPEKIYRIFISGSNSDKDIKSLIDRHIRSLNEYLQRDTGLNLALITWYTPRDTPSNYPTYWEEITRRLHNSDVFIGIAIRFFRRFTIMEWEIAFQMLADDIYDHSFKEGSVFYFVNGISTGIEDETERAELDRFLGGLSQEDREGKPYWYQYKTLVVGDDRRDSDDHVDRVLIRDLCSPLQDWIKKDYGEFKATTPTRGATTYIGGE